MFRITKDEYPDLDLLELAREASYLAYLSSYPVGLGHLHTHDNMTKEAYLERHESAGRPPIRIQADYAMGRMVKLNLTVHPDHIQANTSMPRVDYQSWAVQYPSMLSLFDHAAACLRREKKQEWTDQEYLK
jgi:hypothetical protein